MERVRPSDIATAASYLGWRARMLSPSPWRGARPAELAAMAEHNLRLVLGGRAVARLMRPVLAHGWGDSETLGAVDGKLEAWEWLRLPDGRLMKTNALDHDGAHDLVGPRDPAWDVCGLSIEWDLGPTDAERVRRIAARRRGRPIDARLVAAFRPCYLGHRIGRALMGEARARARGDEAEADRHRRRVARLVRIAETFPD